MNHVPRAIALSFAVLAACSGGSSSSNTGECTVPANCPGSDTECSARTCIGGTCGVSFTAAGTPTATQASGDCQVRQCNGAGGVVSVAANTDVPADDGKQCTAEVCLAGDPAHPPSAVGTPCTQGGGSYCDGAGNCTVCTVATQCPGSDGQCRTRSCTGGACGYTYAPSGTLCSENGGRVCDGAGACADPATAELAAARATPDGTGLSLPVDAALVTYLRPADGTDAAGFTVQSAQAGPALFVAVDPATLSPAPQPGDLASFVIGSMATVHGLREATAISGWSRLATGQPLAALAQEVSASTDLVSGIDGYESELVAASGTIVAAFGTSGSGMVDAQVSTAGVAANPGLVLRTPGTLQSSYDLVTGCTFTVGPTPLWRYTTTAELTAFTIAELPALSCPAPRVVSAFATSATALQVTFDRTIAAGSVLASGSQFTADGGLAIGGASVSGRVVTLVTTAQNAGQSYVLTVATSVQDTTGRALDPAAASTSFTGYRPPATLVLNEVSPNITGSADLVELYVTTGGSTANIRLEMNVLSQVTVLATLPALQVAAGDLIVVHLYAPAGVTDETSAKTACTDPACYAGAWDVRGATTGIIYSYRVLVVRSPTGTIIDAVPFALASGTPWLGFAADVTAIQGLGLWTPADCAGLPCDNTTAPAISASWTGTGTSATGASAQRRAGMVGDQASDWQVATSTFGAAN